MSVKLLFDDCRGVPAMHAHCPAVIRHAGARVAECDCPCHAPDFDRVDYPIEWWHERIPPEDRLT